MFLMCKLRVLIVIHTIRQYDYIMNWDQKYEYSYLRTSILNKSVSYSVI